jgi:hypothetical protein
MKTIEQIITIVTNTFSQDSPIRNDLVEKLGPLVNYTTLAKDMKRRLGRLTYERLLAFRDVYTEPGELGIELIEKMIAMEINISHNNLTVKTLEAISSLI